METEKSIIMMELVACGKQEMRDGKVKDIDKTFALIDSKGDELKNIFEQ